MSIYHSGRPSKYNPTTKSGNKPPSKAGEYRIRNGIGDIVYIGETCNLKRRTSQHIHNGKLPLDGKSTIEWKAADGRSTSATRRVHERQKIKAHHPVLNKSSGGEGRIANKKKSIERKTYEETCDSY